MAKIQPGQLLHYDKHYVVLITSKVINNRRSKWNVIILYDEHRSMSGIFSQMSNSSLENHCTLISIEEFGKML